MNEIRLIAIGASTGGPAVIAKLLFDLPAEFTTPILITQHMPHDISSCIAKQLTHQSGRQVQVAVDQATLDQGQIWLAPHGAHFGLSGYERHQNEVRIRLDNSPSENGYRPAIDPMLRDATKIYGAGTMGVILSGLGRDGVAGCQLIYNAGGIIIVQGPATSAVWGIPGAIARQGFANAVVEQDFLAREIVSWHRRRCLNDHHERMNDI